MKVNRDSEFAGYRRNKPFYNALNEEGDYLHWSGAIFTRNIEWAWKGTLEQFNAMKAKKPNLRRIRANAPGH